MKELVSMTRLVVVTAAALAAVAIGWQYFPQGDVQMTTEPVRLERSESGGWTGVSAVRFQNRTGRPVRLVGVEPC